MKLPLLLLFFLTIICSAANAANLYVSENGSGTNCTAYDPCSSIQMAVDNAVAEDTIHVAAGIYVENVSIGSPATGNIKPGITIQGKGKDETIVVSAGVNTQRPAGIPADIVFDIWSADVTIKKLAIVHPAEVPIGRDIGIFVGPPATGVIISKCKVVRNRIGDNLEPSIPEGPGSRGVLVFRATDSVISKNAFLGNYEDHIHMPTSDSEIIKNKIVDATRLGIVIIQESADSLSTNNIISNNKVINSGGDGIQIQGDNNVLNKNIIKKSGGAAIKLCGINEVGDCINPFDAWSEASDNSVNKNKYLNNGVNAVMDNGSGNVVN